MAETKVARRYAKALMDLGKEQNNVDVLYNDLRLVAQTIRGNRQLGAMFQSPVIHNYKKEAVVEQVFKGKINDATLEFLLIIVRKNRDFFLRDIALAFLDLYKEYKNIKTAFVTTAVPMDDRLRNEVKSIVKKQTGSEIELQETVDKKIIGGYILRWGDNQIDASIASKLHALRRDLSKNVVLQN
jgi:F-type H+-transporting ATPase subunit delta